MYLNSKSYKLHSPRSWRILYSLIAIAAIPFLASGQDEDDEELFELSPFEVSASENVGYMATSSLAGTRIKTQLSDVGSAISVMTLEFMEDLGGTDNETLLSYMVNSEVGGPRGNFSGGVSTNNPRESGLFDNPNGNTRVRGLSSADNTRNFFRTDIPWDNYIVDRVDLQRGPNAILFGLGSPAGIINATTHSAMFDTFGQAKVRLDNFGSFRGEFNYNSEVIEGELAIRVAAMADQTQFRQEPAFEDDYRFYVAGRYAPKGFMNNADTRFEIKASFERGDIESNRPRTVTPQDRYTAWFQSAEEGGLEAPNGEKYAHYFAGGNPEDPNNEWADLVVGNRKHFSIGPGPYYNSLAYPGNEWMQARISSDGHLNAAGEVINGQTVVGDTNVLASNLGRQYPEGSMTSMGDIGAPYYADGFYQDATMQDPSNFDFYNNLLEGPNKRNFTDWDVFELELTNTFFKDRLGYNISYFNQDLNTERWGIMGVPVESGYAIYVDINATTEQDEPNPDFGRPLVLADPGGWTSGTGSSEREALRAQIFGEYDFRDNFDGFFGRLFGKHRFTGLYADDNQETDNRNYRLYDYAPEFYLNYPDNATGNPGQSIVYYLGPSMADLDSPEGVSMDRIRDFIIPDTTGTRSVLLWDPTWTATGVDPGASWAGHPYLGGSIQAENPANYRGWVNRDIEVISFLDNGGGKTYNGETAREYLAEGGTLSDSNIESFVGVWQAYLWNDSIVGTYGYREDESVTYLAKPEEKPDTFGDAYPGNRGAYVTPDRYYIGMPGTAETLVETETTNWSVALHTHRLLEPWFEDYLPFNLSFYYNEGENFQPLSGRVDYFGKPLPPPGGVTEDRSMLISTKDNRYSLRVTKYETATKNQNSTGSISQLWRLQQSIFQVAWSRARTDLGQNNWRIDRHPNPERYENVILPAWREFEADLAATFPEFIDSWANGVWPLQVGDRVSPPAGAQFTEDAVSRGWEFEFIANPSPNWRISLNASQTEAIRDNVPGESFLSLAEFVDDYMMNTPVGEMPYWWIASPPVRTGALYGRYRGQYLSLLALNGLPQPEIREWRFNGTTNYSFTDGRLKGLGIGAAFRWQDEYAVDFPPVVDDDGIVQRDVDNPFLADKELDIDLWASYSFKINDRIRWRIQLNVYNVFGENKLVPINTDPFGNWQAVRIKEGRSWAITNTIDF